MTSPHLNPDALAAFIDATIERGAHTSKAQLAVAVELSPGHLHDFMTARRSGADESLRRRLAEALNVNVDAITCWCEQPSRHRKSKPRVAVAAEAVA